MSYPERQSTAHVPPAHVSGVDTGMWQALLDGVEDAVLVHDGHNVLRVLNHAATLLFPKLSVGGSLEELDIRALGAERARDTELVELSHDGRRLRARHRRLGEDLYAWYVQNVTDEVDHVAELLTQRSQVGFLAEASRQLGSSLHRGRTIRSIAQLAVPTLADSAAVVLPARRGLFEWWRCVAAASPPERGRAGRRVLSTVPGLAAALRGTMAEIDPAELPADAAWALPPESAAPDSTGGSVLMVPMAHEGRTHGVLVLARHKARGGFHREELALVEDFAGRAALALAQAGRFAEQVNATDTLQADLLPPPLPSVPGAVLSATFRPAREPLRVGGDFYEVHARQDGSASFLLGDACGNGVEAAALAGRVRQALNALRLVEPEPARLLHLVNQAVLAHGGNRFTTMLVGSMHPEPSGELELVLGGGGHPNPMVVRADGTVDEVDVPGALVGILPDARFGQVRLTLAPSEVCVLYSDGVTEARGGASGRELFGSERLRAALREFAGLPASTLLHRLEQRVDAWLDGRDHDDIAVLAVQAAPMTTAELG
ncbi:serine phosphatase RsbU (regulator of sigma subunit) [Crossiella equi]|uniref:Serine phosphatase RsbU (Regulator of sigma subunit) n=1 Tax=Crossiella equi TaxID=130796 RepID=A0ABS5A9E7_9PSEU|nr:GAF domain-containing SpoIIE family protein phosphatase [Crossiella equi]MBP2473197.1 serine phosphatase RsbU (regulator of sigma subunit) [Crossiella equi]